jgi:hypothetical protein
MAVGTGIDATGTTDSFAALQAKINATPAGGTLYFPDGTYLISAPLVFTKNINVEGQSAGATFTTLTSGGQPITPTTPFLNGVIIKMTTAANDIFQIFTSSITVNLKKLGLLFPSTLASTGHGVNASPTLVANAGHDMGCQDFLWEQIYVHGVDGNHYGFRNLNPQYGTFVQCRSYGGGGFQFVADAGTINSGNCVLIHPFVAQFNVGTASGYSHISAGTTPGTLNLLTYIRPQCIQNSAVGTAGTNLMWDDLSGAANPKGINVLGADLETAGSRLFKPGTGTTFLANGLINGASGNTAFGNNAFPGSAASASTGSAFGNNALSSATTGLTNTAIGASALQSTTTGGSNTALGNNAGQNNTTGGYNTAVGKSALFTSSTNSSCTAVGSQALLNSTSDNNTAVGASALQGLTVGANNTSVGGQSLQVLTTGAFNTAVGQSAGLAVSGGANNTLIGYKAGVTATGTNAVTTGAQNVFVGYQSGPSSATQSSFVTAVGTIATTNGNNATALGYGTSAGATGAVAIGRDSAGTSASTTVANAIALGTTLHSLLIGTGAGLGGGAGVVSVANASTLPTTNPTAGGILYADAGALKWRGPSGTVTIVGVA